MDTDPPLEPIEEPADLRRERRIAEARRLGAERRPQREAELRAKRERLRREIASIHPDEAQRLISIAEQDMDARYLGPIANPYEWRRAADVAREVAIAAARDRSTITYGEIKLAVFRATGWLVGYSMFGSLVMETNRKDDGVPLSSIVVKKDSGVPGSGFADYVRGQGFDAPLETQQRQTSTTSAIWRTERDQLICQLTRLFSRKAS
jgi:hypothetical protein